MRKPTGHYVSIIMSFFLIAVLLGKLSAQQPAPQTAAPSPPAAPKQPGPPPEIGPIGPPTGDANQTPLSGANAAGQNSANVGNAATSTPAYVQALVPITPTPPPNPRNNQALVAAQPGVYVLDWLQGVATPDSIQTSGRQILRLININDVLYTYQVSVAEIKGADDDLAALKNTMNSVASFLSAPAAHQTVQPPTNCTIASTLPAAQSSLQTLNNQLDSLLPKLTGGKYKSVTLADTLQAWSQTRTAFDTLQSQVIQTQVNLPNCGPDYTLAGAAEKLISDFRDMQQSVIRIQAKVDGPHVVDIGYDLNRTSDYDVSVNENYGGVPTEAKPITFHLKRGFEILSLSGGFLLTEIQARAYSSVTAPSSGSSGTQNVLSVSNLHSTFRPALVALLNYHDPFSWPLNRPNFGFALSAGPTFDISNGKADTSRFGIFVGVTAHLWNRLFITPGLHVGEFADFPQGYTAAGQVIPPNSGTPQAVNRWTSRFAIGITFKTKDLSSVTSATSSTSQSTNPSTQTTTPAKEKSGSK